MFTDISEVLTATIIRAIIGHGERKGYINIAESYVLKCVMDK
jgi:hypothetical protein